MVPAVSAFWISILATLILVVFYWLARMRIQRVATLPSRHVLQLLFLVFPSTFIICSLILREMWFTLSIIFFVISFLFVALEIFLRQITVSIGGGLGSKIKYGIGRNGVQVKYPEALEASGDYPRHYLTESFFQSIQYGNIYEQSTSSRKSIEVGSHYDLAFDYQAPGISVANGLRTTTDQPKSFEKTLMFFGGSTTFGGREVPDDLTFSSFVQRKLINNSKNVRTINHGQGGATVTDRINWLMTETPVCAGDIIVFYFGANDSGWIVNLGGRSLKHDLLRTPVLVLLRRFSDSKFELLKWLHGEFAHWHNKWCAKTQFKATIREFEKARKWSTENGCRFLIVLQPHLYTSKTISQYEESLRGRFSSFLQEQLRVAYALYENFVANCGYGVSATHILSDSPSSVYLDWCHVNARGNEIIANFLHDSLDDLGWLD